MGKRIREERRKKDLTQEMLAEYVNTTHPYIGQIERGERGVSLETLIAICNRLGVTVDYLLHDYLDNEEEYMRQLWIRLMKNRSIKEQDMILNVVKAMVEGMEKN
jgi:transcriptional regulator with XRE-family HTH domain